MQAAHPIAFAGFFVSTGALNDLYARLERTARVMDTIMFGERDEADRMTAVVRRMHGRARGVLQEAAGRFPAGTPWAADDPELLLWIIATLADSGALVYSRYVAPLSRDERDAYWNDWRVVGGLFGLRGDAMPRDSSELDRYVRDMLRGDVLHVSRDARKLGVEIVLRPPVPVGALALRELANFTIIGLLPGTLRRQYRLWWDPLRTAMLNAGAESTRRVLMPLVPDRLRHRQSGTSGRLRTAD
jgi:uncharacterized protein (DUF2236 family)